jgi:diguanylate cyclase (GGDEF)-like protein
MVLLDPSEGGPRSNEPFINLARSLASLHAARDLNELAGHLEHLGERCVDAVLAALLLTDDSGEFRLVSGSLRRSAYVESLRQQLQVERITQNQDITSAARHVAATRASQWFSVAELFGESPEAAAGRHCIISPIWAGGEALGTCLLVAPETPAATTSIAILVEHIGVAVQRLREISRARHLHGIDPNLWIADETSLREALTHELSRARRYGGSVGVTLLSVDCADELRERYGGFYADQLLRKIGGRLTSVVRDTDVLGTLGGGFAVIHPATTQAGALIAAGRLMDEVGSMLSSSFPELELSLISRITTDSVASPDDGKTAGELIARLLAARAIEARAEPESVDRTIAA